MHPAHIDQLRLQIEELRRTLPEIDADEDLREDMLEGCTDYKEVIEKLVYIERITKTMIDGTEIYIDKMQKRKRNLLGKWKGVRDIISSVMESANLRKVDLPSATVTIAKTGRSVPMTLDQWKKYLMTDPSHGWDQTPQAVDKAGKFIDALHTSFGHPAYGGE